MAKKTIQQTEQPQPELLLPREEVQAQITDRIEKGKAILGSAISNANELEDVRNKRKIWHEYNEELLARLFTNDKISKDYISKSRVGFFSMGQSSFYEDVEDFRQSIQKKLTNLESINERLSLFPEAAVVSKKQLDITTEVAFLLHPIIKKECMELVESGYFGEAVEKSFKIVRDKLRTLTGYETSSEAFGKGGLFIKGAAASNVEDDFQSAVKFLGMSIDFFRNEKAHTTTANVSNEEKAYQYLILSSVALQHLDHGEIRKAN